MKMLKHDPRSRFGDDVVVGGSHQGTINGECHGGFTVTGPTKHRIAEEEPARRHVDSGRRGRPASLSPRAEERLRGVGLAVGLGSETCHIVHRGRGGGEERRGEEEEREKKEEKRSHFWEGMKIEVK